MEEQHLIKTINQLITVATVLTVCGLSFYTAEHYNNNYSNENEDVLHYDSDNLQSSSSEEKATDVDNFDTPLPKDTWFDYLSVITKDSNHEPILWEPNPIIHLIDSAEITYTTMEYTFVGRHFITAYCPEECGGSWKTSSGATCHYSDKWYEPTTCAIDRNFHRYGEYILIGDPNDPDNRKIYVTEDTGPGVQGLWVDCFVETMDEVRSWPTRYDNVYSVTWIRHSVNVGVLRGKIANYRFVRDLVNYSSYPYWDIDIQERQSDD